MAHPNAAPQEEIELRREKVRSLMARGIRKPSRILANIEIKDIYSIYKKPYAVLRNDMKMIAKENERMVQLGLKDGVLGNYITGLYELLIQCYRDYNSLDGTAKVGMAKTIRDVLQDIARAYGIDPEKINPAQMLVNIENVGTTTKNEMQLPKEVYNDFATKLAREYGKLNKRSSGEQTE